MATLAKEIAGAQERHKVLRPSKNSGAVCTRM